MGIAVGVSTGPEGRVLRSFNPRRLPITRLQRVRKELWMQDAGVVQAWKDADFWAQLSPEERALIPANPAGLVELTDEALEEVVGGNSCLCWSCDTVP